MKTFRLHAPSNSRLLLLHLYGMLWANPNQTISKTDIFIIHSPERSEWDKVEHNKIAVYFHFAMDCNLYLTKNCKNQINFALESLLAENKKRQQKKIDECNLKIYCLLLPGLGQPKIMCDLKCPFIHVILSMCSIDRLAAYSECCLRALSPHIYVVPCEGNKTSLISLASFCLNCFGCFSLSFRSFRPLHPKMSCSKRQQWQKQHQKKPNSLA